MGVLGRKDILPSNLALRNAILFAKFKKLYLGNPSLKDLTLSLELKRKSHVPFLGSHFPNGSLLESQPSTFTFLFPIT